MSVAWDVDFILTIAQCVLLAAAFCFLYAQGYEVYHGAVLLENQNVWMKTQCQNQTFLVHMRKYSSLCDELLASRDPLTQSLDAVLTFRPWLGLCLIPFTILLCRHLWNCLQCVFGMRDYINMGLPR